MTEKITIRRHPDGWHVTRPAFGFAPADTTVYASGAAALASLTASGIGSASPVAERDSSSTFTWNRYWSTRPRWIEASG